MDCIVSRENIISERIQNVREGQLVLELFHIAEELGIGEEIALQNNFTVGVLKYMESVFGDVELIRLDKAKIIISDVYYVTELYLRGYWTKESYIGCEEFLNLVKAEKVKEIIQRANEIFILHMNRLKKVIVKSKKKIPKGDIYYRQTLMILRELERDISICALYPNTSIDLTEFYFAKYYSYAGPVMLKKLTGIISLEEYVYSLYNELSILSKLKIGDIHKVCESYIRAGGNIHFNLFERVINNYIFAMTYSDEQSFKISKVDAELLMREMKLGTLNAKELVNNFMVRFNLDGYKKEYMERYEKYIQTRIDGFNKMGYFAEMFIITPD